MEVEYSSAILQGDTLIWYARPDALAADAPLDPSWGCRAGLYLCDRSEVVPVFTVTETAILDGAEYFSVQLTSAQTAALTPGKYLLSIFIENDAVSPPYADQSHIEVRVSDTLVPVP
jgi:hypothetical protein